jgi:NAD-reducing hydrogenase large subunit
MPNTITIEPVTRIEGHAKITLQMGETGRVADAQFQVTQVRGFEKFCEGRPFYEMPSLMARICGICPVSHLIASAKACDALLAVRIPKTGADLRRLMNLAQITQSHALSFFHLSSPDLLLGMDADVAKRNVFGVIQEFPDLAKNGIRLRQFGQEVIAILGGKRVHPAWVVPGGVNDPLSVEEREQILRMLPEATQIARSTLDFFKSVLDKYEDEVTHFGNFPTGFMAITGKEGELEHYDGGIRMVDAARRVVVDQVPNDEYADIIAEHSEPWTYLKMPYYKPMGFPDGIYRVAARPPERGGPRRHAGGGQGVEVVPRPVARRGAVLVPLPHGAAHRDRVCAGEDRRAAERAAHHGRTRARHGRSERQ